MVSRILGLPPEDDDSDLDSAHQHDRTDRGPARAPEVPPALEAVLDSQARSVPVQQPSGIKRKKHCTDGRRASFKRPPAPHSSQAVVAAEARAAVAAILEPAGPAAAEASTIEIERRQYTTDLGDLFASGVPAEAFPHGIPRGRANYTVKARNGAANQVLMARNAYYVQNSMVEEMTCSRTIAWHKFGGVEEAWSHAKLMARWDSRRDLD